METSRKFSLAIWFFLANFFVRLQNVRKRISRFFRSLEDVELPGIGPAEILKILPHGPDALMIDRVTKVSEESAEGYRLIAVRDCLGHFKGALPKVLPGWKMLEMAAQIGLYGLLSKEKFRGKLAVFREAKVKFKSTVLPGDRLDFKVEFLGLRQELGIWKGEAKSEGFVGDRRVLSCWSEFVIK